MTGNRTDESAWETSRFHGLIETYGANPDRWPAADRSWAEAFARANPDADQALQAAAALDDALDRAAAPAPSAALTGRILAAAPGAKAAAGRMPGWLFPLWRPAGALAVALFLGVAVGAVAPPSLVGNDAVAEEVDVLGADTPIVAGLDRGGLQ